MIPGVTAAALPSAAEDAYFAFVVALMHLNGADGSTTYTDETGKAWANAGTASALDDAQKKFGSASLQTPGGTGRVATSSHADFGYGLGEFTIEFWLRLAALPGGLAGFFDQRSSLSQPRPTLYTTGAGVLNYFVNGGVRITGTVLLANQWQHIAVSRKGPFTRLFHNGTLVGSPWEDSTNYEASTAALGNLTDSPSLGTAGWFDDLRITKGVGRYVANFTPPASPFSDSGPALPDPSVAKLPEIDVNTWVDKIMVSDLAELPGYEVNAWQEVAGFISDPLELPSVDLSDTGWHLVTYV